MKDIPQILNIQEAKTHLSRWVDVVSAGSEIIIAKAGKPMAKLVPYRVSMAPRALGRLSEGIPQEDESCWDEDHALSLAMTGHPLLAEADADSERVAEAPPRSSSESSP